MRESRPYGSVRGALSNERPYRDFSFPWLGFSFPKALDFPSLRLGKSFNIQMQ